MQNPCTLLRDTLPNGCPSSTIVYLRMKMVASAPFTTGHVMDKEFKASGSYSSKGNSGKLTSRPSLNSRGVLTSCVAQIISMIHTLLCPETHKTFIITPIHKYINDYLRRSAGPNRYQKLAGIVFLESKALRSPG